MPQNLANERSTLDRVMAWCRQATNHYLSQCWPRSMLPYDVTGPQWVNRGWSWTAVGARRHNTQTIINSLAPGRLEWNFGWLSFKLISQSDGWGISSEVALRWWSVDLTDDKSTLVQVMAWCRQATSHYLNQCWPSSVTPYGVTRLQWVNKQNDDCLLQIYSRIWHKRSSHTWISTDIKYK